MGLRIELIVVTAIVVQTTMLMGYLSRKNSHNIKPRHWESSKEY